MNKTFDMKIQYKILEIKQDFKEKKEPFINKMFNS